MLRPALRASPLSGSLFPSGSEEGYASGAATGLDADREVGGRIGEAVGGGVGDGIGERPEPDRGVGSGGKHGQGTARALSEQLSIENH